jgi:hypothetical protein
MGVIAAPSSEGSWEDVGVSVHAVSAWHKQAQSQGWRPCYLLHDSELGPSGKGDDELHAVLPP